ncbi:MAG: helix-turn-helix domain-containing protein [Sulfuricellaceae bacterium]|nr:helix-turn-helix domain-containing protein [Sulfuricellaceae bacterium]
MSAFTFPNVGTLPSRALAMLLQGVGITHRDFWLHAGTYRLSDPIFILRERGWNIQDNPETVPTSDPTQRSAHIKRYYLPQEVISAAGDEGQNYVRRVKEWERKRSSGMAGTIAVAPAVESAGANRQGTDQPKHSTGFSL